MGGTGMSRKLAVTAEPLRENHILGIREILASANIDEGTIKWCTLAGTVKISCEIEFTDGGRAVETIDLNPMLQAWATGLVAEHEGVKS